MACHGPGNTPITPPRAVIEPAIDFTILSTSTQTFLSAQSLPRGQPALLTAAQMPASPGLAPAPPAATRGIGTLPAISTHKPPTAEPRGLAMETGFGPGTCPTRCLRQHLRDSAKVRREFALQNFKDK